MRLRSIIREEDLKKRRKMPANFEIISASERDSLGMESCVVSSVKLETARLAKVIRQVYLPRFSIMHFADTCNNIQSRSSGVGSEVIKIIDTTYTSIRRPEHASRQTSILAHSELSQYRRFFEAPTHLICHLLVLPRHANPVFKSIRYPA